MIKCENCDHSICIGTEIKTDRRKYECHREKGHPRYMRYGIKANGCQYFVKKNPKVIKLFK